MDTVKLRRVGTQFKNWLLQLNIDSDSAKFLKYDLPLVESALDGSMSLPYKGSLPHTYERREGLLSRDYEEASAPFYVTILGSHSVPPEIVERDGKRYAWPYFEDPDDCDE